VTLQQYPCGTKTHFAAHAVFPLDIRAGDRVDKVISVDTRSLEALQSSDNPKGTMCNR
jgi:hypothetical protein